MRWHRQALHSTLGQLFEKRCRAFTETLRDGASSDVDAGNRSEHAPHGRKASLALDGSAQGAAESKLKGSDLLRRSAIETALAREPFNLDSGHE